MTYFYEREDLPEVVREEGGTYLVDGRRFLDSSLNTEQNIQNEIEIRLALLHHVQDENDQAARLAEELDQFDKSVPDFQFALTALKLGFLVAREGWNGKNQFLQLQTPDEYSLMTLPYIYITTVQGDRVPWLASQTDLLATDWKIIV